MGSEAASVANEDVVAGRVQSKTECFAMSWRPVRWPGGPWAGQGGPWAGRPGHTDRRISWSCAECESAWQLLRLAAMPIVHLAVRSTPGVAPFESFEAASWTWSRMRACFPSALGAMLMPNHLHLVTGTDDVRASRRLLARVVGHLQRWWARGCELWERVRMPKIVVVGKSLFQELRYVALNPTRAGLCRDPLEWPWTTHRDVMGAVVDPWIDVERLAKALCTSAEKLRAKWHNYVSGDPSVSISGTPPPEPAAATAVPTRPLHEILCAVAAALRVPVNRLRYDARARPLVVALARSQGWTDNARLATALDTSVRNIQRTGPADPAALRAVELCLGDRRLWAAFERDEPVVRGGDRFPGAKRRAG